MGLSRSPRNTYFQHHNPEKNTMKTQGKMKFQLQSKCATRWEKMLEKYNVPVPSRMQTLCTLQFADDACPIDWELLLAASDSDFSHDISGLDQHMNRDTLKLDGYFVPRFALRYSSVAA